MRLMRWFALSFSFQLVFIFLSSQGAFAQRALPVEPRISVSQPFFGAEIVYDPLGGLVTPYYDNSAGTIRVRGSFSDVPVSLIKGGDLGVRLNGDDSLTVSLALLPQRRVVNGRTYRSGTFSADVPLLNDLRWPVRVIRAELVSLKTRKILARTSNHFWDLRRDRGASSRANPEVRYTSMRTQITDRGLGFIDPNDVETGLERQVRALLPYPSLSSFNSELSANARQLPRYDNDQNVLRACIDYDDLVQPLFWDASAFPPYDQAYGEALAQYTSYRVAREACLNIPDLAVQAACLLAAESSHCIKSRPSRSDFELCVDQVEADVQTSTISAVDEVRYRFLNAARDDRGRIEGHVAVSGMQSSLNAYLRSMEVRWKSALCPVRPRAVVPDELITQQGFEWLDTWATCRDLRVNNAQANTVVNNEPAVYQVTQDGAPNRSERLKVGLGQEGIFSFFLPSLRADKDICAESFILPHAEDAIRTFRTGLQQVFQSTWFARQPDTQEAILLTKALLPLKVGEEQLTDHDIFNPWTFVNSQSTSGLYSTGSNIVSTFSAAAVPNLKRTFFSVPPRGDPLSLDGLDRRGRPFDIAYTISTQLLNGILRERSASPESITFSYRPTWGELQAVGVRTPVGVSPNSEARLDRATLRQISRVFTTLPAGKNLEIKIQPIWNPIVYMAPDLDPAEAALEGRGPYDMPLAYGVPLLEVVFKERDRGTGLRRVTGKTWLRLVGGFVDRYFSLSLNGPFLTPSLVSDVWSFGVRENALPGINTRLVRCGIGSACEASLELDVATLMKNKLRPRFREMLSEIPTPYYFDMEGESLAPYTFDAKAKSQVGQHITFFGDFAY